VRSITATLTTLSLAIFAATGCLEQNPTALTIWTHYDELSSDELWPGFDPGGIPVAIFDGERTWLLRHPSPPPPFQRYENSDYAWVMDGAHEHVRANSSATIGDWQTATLIAREGDPSELAAVLVHESFHVFQEQHHPDWTANEVQLFVYPFERVDFLSLRRLETEALRRSLDADRSADQLCWVAAAISLRRARFALMPSGSVEYERGLELKEGLASYVQAKASGSMPHGRSSAERFGVSQVRDRAYATGSALALSLDRFDPGWPSRLDLETRPLDELLLEALFERMPEPCEFTEQERQAAEAIAQEDVVAYRAQRDELKREFLAKPGWKVVVSADPNAPLWPQNFDPLNVERVSDSEILHSRWLKLQGAGGAIEVLDRSALTVGDGEHPMFNGVRTVVATGFAQKPVIRQLGDTLRLEGPGLSGWFLGAQEERDERTLVIHLGTND
jgi:hypothetical protein